MDTLRKDLLQIYQAGVDAVNANVVTQQWLKHHPQDDCYVIAIGKAAEGMMAGAVAELGVHFKLGLLISTEDYLSAVIKNKGVEIVYSSHPIPDRRSLDAGNKLLEYIKTLPVDAKVLFLISGGASSMVEHLDDSVSLVELEKLNKWLLGRGLDIGEMNSIRSSISQIKFGGLLRFLGNRRADVLCISDVKGDDPGIIGSGLLYIGNEKPLPVSLPDWVVELCSGNQKQLVSHCSVPVHHIIGNLNAALLAAVKAAEKLGYGVSLDGDFIEGDAVATGCKLAQKLIDMEPGVLILGGETTVLLPDAPGKGGRNQHLCLAAAHVLEGLDGVYLLSAGTDGIDGNTLDAGAIVDGGTLDRGRKRDSANDLKNANANAFLKESHDLVHVGATGTNVMDMMILLKV